MKPQLIVLGGLLSIFGFSPPIQVQAINLPSAAEAQAGRQPMRVELYPGYGVNLNFRPTGETIHRVWLDDPSQVTLDFDDPGCADLGEPGSCAATVIHLRRINPLEFPELPASDSTLLTVLTAQNLYEFRLTFPTSGTATYTTLEIQPEEAPPHSTPMTLAQIQGQSGAAVIEQGLSVAEARSLIATDDPLWERIQSFLILLRGGTPAAEAAAEAGISSALVMRLAELGQ
ncbi:MAG: hypothetical protein AAF215_28115 [Cyanobacteria bacterium P01_A01_bin.123]